MVYIRRHGIDDSFRDFVVRRVVLWNALVWLKKHNPFYFDIEIDEIYIQTLPVEGVPTGIQGISESEKSPHQCDTSTNCDICDTNNERSASYVGNNCQGDQKEGDFEELDRSFLLSGSGELNQDETLRQKILKEQVFGTKENPVPWETCKAPLNEFQTNGLISLCFPTLCPNGEGDVLDKERKIPVSLHDALPHLIHFADVHPDGSLTYRFASHHSFPFWIFNRWMRHSLLTQTNVYASKHEHVATLTLLELQEEVRKGTASSVFRGLQVYQANFVGTTGYWYKRTQELTAAAEQLPIPTVFWTVSFADYHLNELQKFMPWRRGTNFELLEFSQKKKMVRDNPHIAAEYFHLRAKCFSEHLHAIFQAEWYWNRIEAQRRASLHMHGYFKAKRDCDIIQNSAKALLGFLAKKNSTPFD
jgi:hypothetical protein